MRDIYHGDGFDVIVSKRQDGRFAVALRDTDAGETLPAVMIFPTEFSAREYAWTCTRPAIVTV